MKETANPFYKAFESRIRLGLMSALAVNAGLDFNSLKEYLDVTDGNLASHIKALEREGFVGVRKSFVGKKPHTRYFITKTGEQAFGEHLKALALLIGEQRKAD